MAGAVQSITVAGIRRMLEIAEHRFGVIEKEEDQGPHNIGRTVPLKRAQPLQDGCI